MQTMEKNCMSNLPYSRSFHCTQANTPVTFEWDGADESQPKPGAGRGANYASEGQSSRRTCQAPRPLSNVPAVMKAIIETGFKGFVAQEFVPKRPDPIASLRQGVQVCDV